MGKTTGCKLNQLHAEGGARVRRPCKLPPACLLLSLQHRSPPPLAAPHLPPPHR